MGRWMAIVEDCSREEDAMGYPIEQPKPIKSILFVIVNPSIGELKAFEEKLEFKRSLCTKPRKYIVGNKRKNPPNVSNSVHMLASAKTCEGSSYHKTMSQTTFILQTNPNKIRFHI